VAELFPREQFFVIAGPCVVEDDALNIRIAKELQRLSSGVPGGIVFKASFDKANRSNRDAARGPGVSAGLTALSRVKDATGMSVITDVHLPDQCAQAASVADALQIPAFLCRQTDLLKAAGATGRPVNIKKGQWLQPEGMRGAVDKVRGAGKISEIAVTERDTFFGYGDLVVDMRAFARMRDATGCPAIFDATHSVQRPGLGEGGASGGAREFIPPLALAAVAAGANGVFIETHPDPDNAPSDGPNMLPLSDMESLLDRLVAVWETVNR
jgi:2-dehydro-3-deoxyphosphooctonate aldolase (KDO 8-P synthase)